MNIKNKTIAVIGLGYVGLPLAIEFGKYFKTIGFDINSDRITNLLRGIDSTNECSKEEIISSQNLSFISLESELDVADIFIVTVPTPIDEYLNPNFEPLISATKLISPFIASGNVVIYESTVYPGATEEICLPIIESISGLKVNDNFGLGYSPERINPGDKNHRISDIVKVTSGSNDFYSNLVDELYKKIISAGTHKAPTIKIAEAAKIIENVQRDVNIALINELSILFDKLAIETGDVLEAASTKWNFINLSPGMVGGHCIGVDPYYLTHKAQSIGFHPEMILAGRRMNDGMPEFVSKKLIRALSDKRIHIRDSRVLILGFTFKEDCPDTRNTKVEDLSLILQNYHINVEIYDPWITNSPNLPEKINFVDSPKKASYDAVIIAVAHSQFKEMGIELIKEYAKEDHVIFDLKSIFENHETDIRL